MTHSNKIFGWLSVPALLLTAACSDQAGLDSPESGILSEGQTVINLTLNTESQTAATRAEDTVEYPRISDGEKANLLIYSVYEKQQDGSYTLADGFGDGTTNQKRLDVTQFPVTLQFIIDKEAEYTVAFWAQSSETNAFETSDLKKVKVNYSEAKNNDELRDAFCATAKIKGSDNNSVQKAKEVTLRRPLAQINVGTTGWDYEAAAILRPNPRTYAMTKVKLNGLAQYYNVLTGLTLTQEELGTNESALTNEVTFSMSRMPAFLNLTEVQWQSLSYLPYSKEFGPKDDNSQPVYNGEIENFLKVDPDNDESFKPYYSWSDYQNAQDPYTIKDTETFKWLSMCYVLVPVSKDTKGNVQGASIPSFTFYGDDKNETDEREFFTVHNIPVQQNWRTNILSDKIFMADVKYKIYIVPTYCGDYNNLSGNLSGDSKDDWNNIDKMEQDKDGIWQVVEPEKPGTPNPDWDGYNDNYTHDQEAEQ